MPRENDVYTLIPDKKEPTEKPVVTSPVRAEPQYALEHDVPKELKLEKGKPNKDMVPVITGDFSDLEVAYQDDQTVKNFSLIVTEEELLRRRAVADAQNQRLMAEQLQVIKAEEQKTNQAQAAFFDELRRQRNRGHLTGEQRQRVLARMKKGGGIQLPPIEEVDKIIREEEKERIKNMGGMAGVIAGINNATRSEAGVQEPETPQGPELLQKPISAPAELKKPVNQKRVAELLDAQKNNPSEALTTDLTFLNTEMANKTPEEIITHLKLENIISPEDIQINTASGKRIDPAKRDLIIDAVRLRHGVEAIAAKGVNQVSEEIDTTHTASRDALDKIRAAIKQNTTSKEDAAAEQKLRGYVDLFRKRVKEEFSKAYAPTSIDEFTLPVAKIFVGELQSILPGITAEEFLAAISVIDSRDGVRQASQDFQKQVYEEFRSERLHPKLIEVPLRIKFKREDIQTNEEILTLLRNITGNEPPELQAIFAQVRTYNDNLLNAIKHFGLENLLKPADVRTEGNFELVGAIDADDYKLFFDAIRLKYIVEKQLFTNVDAVVNEQLRSVPSENMLSYRRLYEFSEAKFPEAPAESKHLLEQYRSDFQRMVDRELNKHNKISKALGAVRATLLPGTPFLIDARHKAAAEFVQTKQNDLPPGITADQFLAAMTVADTYKTTEDEFKKEVIEWYSKWYKKNQPPENNTGGGGTGGERRQRRGFPFLRRRGGTPPNEPPAPQPPNNPGNGPDNQPPGGNPLPEQPPAPPGGGAAGGAPNPDNQPPSARDNDGDDTIQFDVSADVEPPAGADNETPPNQNTIENAQPAPQTRRSLRNELTPRKLSEQAVKLYKKTREQAQRAVKLAYEGSPYELSEGLLRSAVKVHEVETSQLIKDEDFLNKLNDFRGDEGADIRRRVENMNENDILEKWGLDGEFNERTVKDNEIRDQLLDAIYTREISRNVFHANESSFEEEVKKVSPESITQFHRFESNVVDFLPEYLAQVTDFQMRMLGRNMNLNPITAAQYVNSERFRIAKKIFDENKKEMPADATPEQFLAALSVGESLLQMSDGIFNDLYAVYEQEENQVVPNVSAQTGSENSIQLPSTEKKKRKNVQSRFFGKRENPAIYLQSNNLLISAPRVNNVLTNRLIKINDVINTSLPKFRREEHDRIQRMEIENRDLNDIVTKWRLKTLFSESYIANDNENIRESQQLVDAIILREIARHYFEQLKPNFDAQLATIVPKQSLEQYQAHEAEVLKLYPEFQQAFQRQYDAMRRSHPDVDTETRRKDFIASRNIAAREIFDRNQTDMPEGSTSEKLLAALSLHETYLQIQDKLFQDLYHAYISSTPPDNDETGNSSRPPRNPGSGSGGRGPNQGPRPEPNPSPGGAHVIAEEQHQDDDAVVAQLLEGIDLEPQTVSSQQEIQQRLEKLAAGKN